MTLISAEDYLRLEAKPAFEYQDGALTQKPLPTWKHSLLQARIAQLLMSGRPQLLAGSELTVRLREGRYLVPDVAAQFRQAIQDPYPSSPLPLCVEVLSPSDVLSEVVAKGEEYHAWGVSMVWIVDPVLRTAWEFARGGRLHEIPASGALTAEGISVSLPDIFSVL
ncbi:MAG: Uma2 family endonuclease [Bryobacteraceae bacterium]|nr:Uma2 family endonuclease [Bryobacteraceae bacterium]